MTQKILNVKNILRIIISVLIIFSMLKSCALAQITNDTYTYKKISFNGTKEEALASVWELLGYDWEQTIAISIQNQTNLLNKIYDNKYFITYHKKSGTDLIWTATSNINEYYTRQTSYIRYFSGFLNGRPTNRFDTLNNSNTGLTIDLSNVDYILKYIDGEYYEYSINDSTIVTDTFNFEPNYDAITKYKGYQQLYTKKYDYSINNWQLGNLTPSEYYKIYDIQLLDSAGNILYKNTYNNEYGTNTNNNFFISRVDNNLYIKSMALNYNKIYTLVIYPKDNEGNISENNFVGTYMYLPLNAEISGDTILNLGSGDYTIQDNTNEVINTINSLFTMDENDIQDLRNKISGDMNLADKIPVGTTIELLEGIQNVQPGDFKISWEAVSYTDKNTQNPIVIIPSGEINFSEKVRNNETAETIHNYTRIIFNGAMGFLILYEIWKCICITLGIGTELYDDYKDENAVITTEHEHVNENTGTITRTTTKRKGRKSASYTRSGKL